MMCKTKFDAASIATNESDAVMYWRPGPAYKYCTMAWTHCSLANAWPIKTVNSKVMN